MILLELTVLLWIYYWSRWRRRRRRRNGIMRRCRISHLLRLLIVLVLSLYRPPSCLRLEISCWRAPVVAMGIVGRCRRRHGDVGYRCGAMTMMMTSSLFFAFFHDRRARGKAQRTKLRLQLFRSGFPARARQGLAGLAAAGSSAPERPPRGPGGRPPALARATCQRSSACKAS